MILFTGRVRPAKERRLRVIEEELSVQDCIILAQCAFIFAASIADLGAIRDGMTE